MPTAATPRRKRACTIATAPPRFDLLLQARITSVPQAVAEASRIVQKRDALERPRFDGVTLAIAPSSTGTVMALLANRPSG